MRIMIAQIAPRVGEIQRNATMMLEYMERAAASGCDLIVFPELSITGYPPEDLLLRPAFLDRVERYARRVIEASGEVCVVFGAPRRCGDGLRNSAWLARRGRLIGVYDKQRLPNYGVFDEARYFTPGDGSRQVFEVGGYRVGVGICEDLWHDELARAQAALACDVWLNLNASPFCMGKQREREELVCRRARQFACPIVYVNLVGGQDELVFDGGSHAVDAEGHLLLRAPLFRAHAPILDLEAVGVSQIIEPPEPLEQLRQALVIGIRDYVRRNGCSQVVIGLSGGIDSALTAALAAEALGPANVLGVLMPSKYSSDHSISDAKDLAERLGIETIILPIDHAVAAIEATLADVFAAWGKTEPDVTEENIQARVRGVLLMAISNKTGRMVLATGNKSEMAVGYATLYGDMAGGFAVLKDVYKTQVFALARWLNREREVIPEHIIEKPPSAELRPNQKDTDSLPEYDVLDGILKAHIEERLGVEGIVARGYDRTVVRKVVRMLQAAEYKRRQAPPGVKVTRRAFGRDRRYPITHGFWEWE